MDNKEINAALAALGSLGYQLENAFMENGGEVTEELQAQLDQQENLRLLLEGEGIDSLGRWLKSVQDRAAALKAEKDAIARRIAACAKTEEYVKFQIRQILDATGKDAAKGTCYSFTPYVSRSYIVEKEQLRERYAATVEQAIRAAGVPEYVGVSLTASGAKATELGLLDEDASLIAVDNRQTVKFLKPRASKEG